MKIKHFRLGATGQFPAGKIDETDEGQIRLAVAADYQQAIVRIVFGTPLTWLGLPASEARQFAAMLVEQAEALERRRT